MKLAVRIIVMVAALFNGYAIAQDKSDGNGKTLSSGPIANMAPTLSTEQKQAIQIQAQRIEIAQLRAQAAQAEFDRARTEIAALVQSLQKDGYDLDLQTLSYVPKKVHDSKK